VFIVFNNELSSKVLDFHSTNVRCKLSQIVVILLFESGIMISQSVVQCYSKDKGYFSRCLQTFSKFNWLPQQRRLGDCQTNIGIIIPINVSTKPLK